LKQATQQKILKALNQALADLSKWLRGLGLSEAEVVATLSAVMRENGMMAGVVRNLTSSLLPVNAPVNMGAERAEQTLAWVRSGEYAVWLLSQPEPTPKELDQILLCYRSVLANVRQQFQDAAKLGPRHRRGGRPKEIDDPGERKKIREALTGLSGPGRNLEDLFKRFADKYDVSATTIKRIWLEKPD
jgi:hypothetical protein